MHSITSQPFWLRLSVADAHSLRRSLVQWLAQHVEPGTFDSLEHGRSCCSLNSIIFSDFLSFSMTGSLLLRDFKTSEAATLNCFVQGRRFRNHRNVQLCSLPGPGVPVLTLLLPMRHKVSVQSLTTMWFFFRGLCWHLPFVLNWSHWGKCPLLLQDLGCLTSKVSANQLSRARWLFPLVWEVPTLACSYRDWHHKECEVIWGHPFLYSVFTLREWAAGNHTILSVDKRAVYYSWTICQ